MAMQLDFPSQTNDVQGITRYLYRMAEQLNQVLNNLGTENMSDEYQKTIQDVASSSDKVKALAKLLDNDELAKTKSVRDLYKTLRDSVFSRMDNITASFSSLLEKSSSEIKSYVEANYYGSEPGMTLTEKISSLIQQTSDQIRLEFNTQATANAAAIQAIAIQYGTYFQFKETGLEIGKVGDGASPIVTRITNERMEFIIAGTEVVLAYFDGASNKFKVNMAEIDTLSLGNDAAGYMDIDMTADGLFWKWR